MNVVKFNDVADKIISLTETEKAEVVENFHNPEKLKFSPLQFSNSNIQSKENPKNRLIIY